MASGLSIVIDTRNAEQNIKNLNQALERLENQGNSIANMMRSLGALNPFAGLNTSITQLKDTFNGVASSSNTAKTAIKNLADTFTTAKTAIDSAEASLRQFNQTAGASGGLGRLNGALTAAQNSLNQTNNTIHNTQNNFTQLNNTVNASANVFNRNVTVVNNYNQSLNNAGNAANRANSAFNSLNSTLSRLQSIATGGALGMMALSVAKTADEMQAASSKIRNATTDEEQYIAVKQRLIDISNKNFQSLDATTKLYQRSAMAMKQMGKSQEDVLKFTDALNLAMRVGGSSANEQRAALLQLAQALGSGVLRGDEFNSAAENAPIVIELIAKKMKVAAGEVRELASEGKVSAKILIDAVTEAKAELEKKAASMPVTMSQAWQQVNNSYKTFVDNFMNGTGGMSQGIASMLQGVAKNFDTIVKGMTLAGGWAFVQFARSVDVGTKAMGLFNLVTKANPLILIVSTILAASSAFYGLDDVINTTSVIMGDLIHMITDGWTGIFNLIGDGLNSLQGVVAQNNDDIGKSYKDMFTNATTDHDKFIANATFASNNLVKTISTDNMKNEQSYLGFYQKSEKGFTGLVQNLVGGVVAITAAFAGFFTWVGSHFADLGRQIANAAMDVADFGREVIDAGKRKLGFDVKPRVKEQRYALTNMDARDAFAEFNREGQKWVHDYFSTVSTRSAPQTVTGGISQSLYAPIDPNAKPPSASDDKDGKKKKKDDLQIQVFNAWKNAGLSAQQAMLLTAEVGRENAYNAKYLFGYHKDANNGKLNVGMLSWQGPRATDLSKYLTAAGVLKNGKIEKSQEALNAQAQFAVKEIMSNPAYAKTKTVFLANKDIDTNTGFNVLGRDFIRWDMDSRKINATPHKNRRNNYYAQIQAKVGDKDLVSSFMEQAKAHDDYVASVATGEAKIRAELEKTIKGLPSKGFSGQALEDEKKRLTEEAQFDIDLSRETNRQKLDELMGVHKTKKEQILDESKLQSLTIAADESKSREQRKTEMDALDVGTKEKIRLNDIANKYELSKIWAFRKTSSELIADEWDEKIQAAKDGNLELKDEYIASYKEQKQLALDIDKLNYQQQLLDLQKFNMADIAYLEQTLKIKKDLIQKSNATPEMKKAQDAAAEQEAYSGIFDTREKSANNYLAMINGFHGLGKNYEANKAAEDNKKANFGILDSALQNGILSSEAQQKGISEYELYLERVKEINTRFIDEQKITMIGGYQSIFGGMSDILKMFGGENRKSYMALLAIQKGYVLQAAFLNNKKAISDAWATDGNYFTKAIAAGKVILQNQEIMSAITSFSPKGFSTGGYTGNMGVNDIAGVVHGKEYVLNAAATKRIGVDNLNAMNRGAGVGTKVIVNNYSNENATVDTQPNGDVMITIGKMINDITDAKIEQRFARTTRQGWGVSR